MEELIREYQEQITKVEKRIAQLKKELGYLRGEQKGQMEKRIGSLYESRAGLLYSLREMTRARMGK